MDVVLHLCETKFAVNVGGALRAAHIFGAEELTWTGPRVGNRRDVTKTSRRESMRARLPREERMRHYSDVPWGRDDDALERYIDYGLVPVCVELVPGAESLADFEHPERAVYVFGPEDGGVRKGVRQQCHRFVQIPGRGCLNLAAAVNVTLYDRAAKAGMRPVALAQRGSAPPARA